MFSRPIAGLFVLASLVACTGQPPACETGQPVPIFDTRYPAVVEQAFEVAGQNSLETVRIDTWQGVDLELRQSGCEAVTQEYTFTLPADHPTVGGGAGSTAANLFYMLGGIDRQLAHFQAFGDAMNDKRTELLDGKEVELVPGMRIKVDQLQAGEEIIQRVVLRQTAQ